MILKIHFLPLGFFNVISCFPWRFGRNLHLNFWDFFCFFVENFNFLFEFLLFYWFFAGALLDVICGQSLVGSNACGPPVSQIPFAYQIGRHYLRPFSSSGSDTIEILKILGARKLVYEPFIVNNFFFINYCQQIPKVAIIWCTYNLQGHF